jgi:tetratricopeptide (TPR) repeat protein
MSAGVLISVANLLADLHQLDEAIGTYEQALALLREREPGVLRDSDMARIDGELALLHRRADSLDDALQCIDDSLTTYERMAHVVETISAQRGFSFYIKGTILTNMQRHDEAITCYDLAIENLLAAPAGVQLAAQIEAARMSKALSFGQIGRLDEAIRDLDRVIAKRKEWVEELGLIDYSVDLARAYNNKARALSQKGDFQGEFETKLKAYGLLSELNNKFQRKDIRRGLIEATISIFQFKLDPCHSPASAGASLKREKQRRSKRRMASHSPASAGASLKQ